MIRSFFLATFVLLALPVFAYQLDIVGKDSGEVMHGHEVVLRFIGDGAGERAQKTAAQLLQMAALGLNPSQIKFIYPDHQLVATILDNPIFTVTAKEVEVNQTPELLLAKEWLVRIQKIFDSLPGSIEANYAYANPENQQPAYAWVKSFQLPETQPPYTAAHREFPQGTKLRLVNPDTQWSIVVQVGPRYPMPEGVSILLNPSTCSAIGMPVTQVGRVLVEVVPN